MIYYFIRFVKQQSAVLGSADVEAAQKLKLIADGLVQNWGMWITVIAFVIVVLIVNLLRTRAFDYAWRIAIIAGGVVYILVMLAGDFCLNVQLDMVSLILYTVISVVVGIILEFFVFGGDYSRTERLEYEDDEYYYYVKAVPKAAVTTSERSIKKINGDSSRGDRKAEDDVVTIGSGFDGPGHRRTARNAAKKKTAPSVKEKKEVKETAPEQPPMRKTPEVDKIDFEKKLEESLKDL